MERKKITEKYLLKNGYEKQGTGLYVRQNYEFGILRYCSNKWKYFAEYGQFLNINNWICEIKYISQLKRLNYLMDKIVNK